MTIEDRVPGCIPAAASTAMIAGITTMGAPDLDIVVTTDFVATVRDLTGNTAYDDDRNGGLVAARTIKTDTNDAVVVANWNVLQDETTAEVERVLAHEVGHVAIAARDEDFEAGIFDMFPDNYWNFQSAHGAGVAIDEYRCEAAVYKAGYPVEKGRSDSGIGDELYGLNIQLLSAQHKFQEHLDVEQLRDEVLMIVLLNVRYMGCIAARHIHHDDVRPTNLDKYAAANWKTLIAPTWSRFIDHYSTIPDAFTHWPDPAGTRAAASAVPVIHELTKSFGYKASQDEAGNELFHITMTPQSRQVRLNRANAESNLYELRD